jgi:hypothetical protein
VVIFAQWQLKLKWYIDPLPVTFLLLFKWSYLIQASYTPLNLFIRKLPVPVNFLIASPFFASIWHIARAQSKEQPKMKTSANLTPFKLAFNY